MRQIIRFVRITPAMLLAVVYLLGFDTCAPPHIKVVRAEEPANVQIGTSFSRLRAAQMGLDPRAAYSEILDMKFSVIRISTYWSEDETSNFAELDWQVKQAETAGQPLVLSVGMKGLGYPEFYIPKYLLPTTPLPDKADLGSQQAIDDATLRFVKTAVERYRGSPAIIAWQVENEPLEESGPQHWKIGSNFLAKEVGLVKGLDDRPVVVNAFAHWFDSPGDQVRRSVMSIFSAVNLVQPTEQQSIGMLGRGDIFGLDGYSRIGFSGLGLTGVWHWQSDWQQQALGWRKMADRQGSDSWAMEVQAEPWLIPKTASPSDNVTPSTLIQEVQGLREDGYSHIVLWGAEYWLAERDRGNPSWLLTAQYIRDNVNSRAFGEGIS